MTRTATRRPNTRRASVNRGVAESYDDHGRGTDPREDGSRVTATRRHQHRRRLLQVSPLCCSSSSSSMAKASTTTNRRRVTPRRLRTTNVAAITTCLAALLAVAGHRTTLLLPSSIILIGTPRVVTAFVGPHWFVGRGHSSVRSVPTAASCRCLLPRQRCSWRAATADKLSLRPLSRRQISTASALHASISSSDGGAAANSSNVVPDVAQILTEPSSTPTTPGIFPKGDDLDKRLIKISLPVIANFAIGPLIGAVDLFWVNQMGNALAVAGQAAANQVFNSVFWLTSFLPAVTATLISRENAGGNTDGVQQAVRQALLVGWGLAIASTALLLAFPSQILSSVLKDGAPALEFAKPYLVIRALAFLPSLTSLVGFSAFRGVLDTVTPVKISLAANLINCVLDPILIFTFKMGVPGAALATLVAELASGMAYLALLKKRQLMGSVRSLLRNMPTLAKLKPLLKGGAALQLRNVALNLTFLAVARVVQSIDETGVAAAAHALSIQTFQVGGIVLLALSTVAQTVVPNDLYQSKQNAKSTVNRLMGWGLVLGIMFGMLQLALVPVIQRSSPLVEVRDAARIPALLASVFQVMNGLVFIGEGIMIGTGNFFQLSLNTVIATAGCLLALGKFPPKYGLTGVWFGFGVFNSLRLLGVAIHQFYNGPLASRNLRRQSQQLEVKRTSTASSSDASAAAS